MKLLRRLLALPLLAALMAGPLAAAPLDATPRIAVLSAFEPEWTALRAVTQESTVHGEKGVSSITGTLEGKPVVLVLTGISMVNAAMTTQMALDRFNVTRIVLSGVAGGVDPSLAIGDVVVPDQWAEYLEAIFARKTPQGFELPPGVKTDLPNFGMIHPRGVRVFREGQAGAPRQFWFPVDPAMMAVARTAAGGIALKNCPADGVCLTHVPKVVVGGNGVSGAAFVDNAEFRTFAFDAFKAQVLDMESAAVAHVAATNGVPYIVMRSLSDLAGGGPGANEIRIFEQLAAQNAVTVLRAFIKALPN
ncbi:MAG: 5'-methylthioadenosine/S-adenosylhomocysteine nucleosidase [Xanthobacteraceae bacterium]